MCQCKNKADTKNIHKDFKRNQNVAILTVYEGNYKEMKKTTQLGCRQNIKSAMRIFVSMFRILSRHTNRCVPTSHEALPCQHCAKHNEFSISIILGIMGYFIIIDGDKHGFGQDKPHNEL